MAERLRRWDKNWGLDNRGRRLEELELNPIDTRCHKNLALTGSNPVLTTNVIRLTAKNGINEEYYKWLQTLMIYKWVNSIITLNSQVAEW